MTLLDAQEIDPEKVRKQRKRIIFASLLVITVLAVGVLGFLLGHGWWFQYWPDERKVGRFFEALQKQDFKTAYAIWMNDPNWPEHFALDTALVTDRKLWPEATVEKLRPILARFITE